MTTNKNPRKKYRPGVRKNPVGLAVARASLRDTALELKINMYLTEEGEHAPELLGHLALVIGTCAEAGLMVYGPEPWVKRMHAGLRNVQALCLDNGYRWSKASVTVFEELLDTAAESLMTMPLPELLVAHDAALWFCRVIKAQKVSRDTVLGVEAWNKRKGTPT